MGNKNYTIKDIARMAGVSAGTVDRVLHNRGDVSASSLEKVRKVLDEINYQPNMFAIGLAAKKRYSIVCIIPYYMAYDYWYAVAGGIDRAAQELAPYNVTVNYIHYLHADEDSYRQACTQVLGEECDAVLLAPNFREETLKLTSALERKGTPYAFIDFNVEQTNVLCYIGQDSRMSGYIAAKILMRHFREGQEVALFLNNQKQSPAEIQMQRRLEGFMQYLTEKHVGLAVHDVVLDKQDADANRRTLDRFFDECPQAVLGVVFNSRVYQVADYLHATGRRMENLLGYDLLKRNVERLKTGEVDYLIGQRPAMQGYCGVKALCTHMVFKRPVTAMRYMPIDVLMKENIDFYFEFE